MASIIHTTHINTAPIILDVPMQPSGAVVLEDHAGLIDSDETETDVSEKYDDVTAEKHIEPLHPNEIGEHSYKNSEDVSTEERTEELEVVAEEATYLAEPDDGLSEEERRQAMEIEALNQRLIASEEMFAEFRQQVEEESEEVRNEAKKAGFEQGLAEGIEAAQERVAAEIQHLQNIADQLSGLEQQVMETAEDSMVEIVYASVCKLLGNTIVNGEAIKGVVSQLIERTRGMRITRIRMRSDDCKKILDLVASDSLGGDFKKIEFQPDDSIEIGGCILEGDAGTLDGRLESQLENLRSTLLAARASSV